MAGKFSTPGFSEESHDAIHEWNWHGGVRGVPGASYSTSKRAVFGEASDHQIEQAKQGNLINVKVERLQENEDTGDFQWGILTQPAYCKHCISNKWRAPQRTIVRATGSDGNQGPMLRQEQDIHEGLKDNPELIPSEEEMRAERRGRLGKYDRG
jgi:hypothetical protein